MLAEDPSAEPVWRDSSRPITERVAALVAEMTLEEKIAQLYGVWVGVDPASQAVAPHQHELADATMDFPRLIRSGLGQLTRPFGTAPVEPAAGAKTLVRLQEDIVAANRFGIPALVHEECLSGFMAYGATIYPTPLAWGASFDPDLTRQMATRVGSAIRSVGGHQGLAPVLDVTRDVRWGRTEETIAEDPYLVATIGTAYVEGLQSAGVVATLKHFAGYAASAGGRNFGPVAMGSREFADEVLLPFEMALRDGGAGSVMASYNELDGVPSHSDGTLLSDLLRDTWQFGGTTVADYFGVSFLELHHRIASSLGEAAGRALAAGVDVELPSVRCFGMPLVEAVRDGVVAEPLIDRAASRVLQQKALLGLLDADWTALPPALREDDHESDSAGPAVDLDPPEARALARQLAEESVVLLSNDGVLPLRSDVGGARGARGARVAVVGPTADDPRAMLGCYAFPNHHGDLLGSDTGVEIQTVLDAVRSELAGAQVDYRPGCDVSSPDRSLIAPAADLAAEADVCVAVLGDRSALFGRGTSGEGCDAEDLRLPGVQAELLSALLETGTPVVLVLLTGRPYALGPYAGRLAAIVQAYFPGEEGASAVSGVLSGRVCPSGRLPVSVPYHPYREPVTYLAPPLGRRSGVSNVDPTPAFPFGHGLSYTTFEWDDVRVDGRPVSSSDDPESLPTDGEVDVSVRVRNAGDRAGADVVQLYLHDPVAQVTRPVVRLIGYARVSLEPGESRSVTFRMHADVTAFTGLRGDRIVEPGDLELRLSRSSEDVRHVVRLILGGHERVVDHNRQLTTPVEIT